MKYIPKVPRQATQDEYQFGVTGAIKNSSYIAKNVLKPVSL